MYLFILLIWLLENNHGHSSSSLVLFRIVLGLELFITPLEFISSPPPTPTVSSSSRARFIFCCKIQDTLTYELQWCSLNCWCFFGTKRRSWCSLDILLAVVCSHCACFLSPSDRVFGPSCSTWQVYEEGAKEVALSVVSGINCMHKRNSYVLPLPFSVMNRCELTHILACISSSWQQAYLPMGKQAAERLIQ